MSVKEFNSKNLLTENIYEKVTNVNIPLTLFGVYWAMKKCP